MHRRIDRRATRQRIRHRIRRRIRGTAGRPRVAVYRSEKHIYAQAIDDDSGKTVAHASTRDAELRAAISGTGNIEAAKAVGEAVAKRLLSSGVETIVFDRGGYLYHGRVKALGEAMRTAGLKF